VQRNQHRLEDPQRVGTRKRRASYQHPKKERYGGRRKFGANSGENGVAVGKSRDQKGSTSVERKKNEEKKKKGGGGVGTVQLAGKRGFVGWNEGRAVRIKKNLRRG